MKTFNVNEVADTLITLANEEGIEVSNLKLQKLMYYAQAWSLVVHKAPLFTEDFEAWVHGPVLPSLFRRFREYRWGAIEVPATHVQDDELKVHLRKILKTYGKYGASELERLSHSEDPWKDARGELPPDMPSNRTIKKASMAKFYLNMAHVHTKSR